jgi:hypothetical protein
VIVHPERKVAGSPSENKAHMHARADCTLTACPREGSGGAKGAIVQILRGSLGAVGRLRFAQRICSTSTLKYFKKSGAHVQVLSPLAHQSRKLWL